MTHAEAERMSLTSPPAIIVERDDGRFQVGFSDDAPGPFETRAYASAVAKQRTATRPP